MILSQVKSFKNDKYYGQNVGGMFLDWRCTCHSYILPSSVPAGRLLSAAVSWQLAMNSATPVRSHTL